MSGILGTLAHVMVSRYGLAGVFAAMTLESVGIPLPSEVTMPLGAFAAASRGPLALILVVAAGTVGNLVGSLCGYAIGAAIGRGWRGAAWLDRGHWDAAHAWFVRRGGGAVFVGRLLPVVRTYISFPAGAAGMPLPRFTAYTVVGSAIWCAALAAAGYALGSAWTRIGGAFVWFTAITVAALVVAAAAVAVLWWRRRNAAGRRPAPGGPA